MRKIFALLLMGLAAACHENTVEPENKPDLRILSAAEVQISDGTNDFAFDLYHRLNESQL